MSTMNIIAKDYEHFFTSTAKLLLTTLMLVVKHGLFVFQIDFILYVTI